MTARQAEYFRYCLSQFSDRDLAHYAYAYRDPDHLHAAFDAYCGFPANEKFLARERGPTDLPMVIGSGEHDVFAMFVPRIAAAVRAHGCMNLTVEMIPGARHYVAEEKPDSVAELIARYAAPGGK